MRKNKNKKKNPTDFMTTLCGKAEPAFVRSTELLSRLDVRNVVKE